MSFICYIIMIFRLDSRPAGSSNNNGGGVTNGGVAAAMLKSNVDAMPTAKDAEEYYCLRQPDPDDNETGSSLRSSPDVVAAQKGKASLSDLKVGLKER